MSEGWYETPGDVSYPEPLWLELLTEDDIETLDMCARPGVLYLEEW